MLIRSVVRWKQTRSTETLLKDPLECCRFYLPERLLLQPQPPAFHDTLLRAFTFPNWKSRFQAGLRVHSISLSTLTATVQSEKAYVKSLACITVIITEYWPYDIILREPYMDKMQSEPLLANAGQGEEETFKGLSHDLSTGFLRVRTCLLLFSRSLQNTYAHLEICNQIYNQDSLNSHRFAHIYASDILPPPTWLPQSESQGWRVHKFKVDGFSCHFPTHQRRQDVRQTWFIQNQSVAWDVCTLQYISSNSEINMICSELKLIWTY